ncbi:MAG: 23S rRNA (pseudouridine(1915)-N(3))-methyltransferase RlmH [Halanaerobiales bacterium]
MKVNIVAVGKIKENYIKNGINKFVQRLQSYTDVEQKEVSSSHVPRNPSGAQLDQVKVEEGKRLLKVVPADSYKISLDVKGKPMTSEGLAKSIHNLQVKGFSNISFIVGGPHGLSEEVLNESDYQLSLSHMTFTHQMIRLILLEQLYRAFKIMNNEPYHK